MLGPPSLKFAEFRYRDFIAMLFLLTAFALESKCKDMKNNPFDQKYFLNVAENEKQYGNNF